MALGKQIISSGGEVAKDVAAGKKFKQALRHRLKYGLGKMIDRAVTNRIGRSLCGFGQHLSTRDMQSTAFRRYQSKRRGKYRSGQ